jgi:hypothetical protein
MRLTALIFFGTNIFISQNIRLFKHGKMRRVNAVVDAVRNEPHPSLKSSMMRFAIAHRILRRHCFSASYRVTAQNPKTPRFFVARARWPNWLACHFSE